MRNAARIAPPPRLSRKPEHRVPRAYESAPPDAILFISVACLVAIGMVMVFSASSTTAYAVHHDVAYFFKRQLMWLGIGSLAAWGAFRIDYTKLRTYAPALFIATTLALVAVLVPHLGKGAGGSSRWLGAGPITLQPSEIAKLAFALFAADLVARRERCRDQLHELVLPLALVAAILGALILKQPDLGTAIVVVGIAAILWYAGGVRGRLLATVVGVLAVLGSILVLAAPYRRARLLAFLNPFGHASTVGYQLVQSLASLGSGHLAGHPMANAVSPWLLPNASSDFIFAAIGNDFGLLGCLAVVCGFACFGWLGIRIALRAEDRYRALLATAITGWIVFQALVNMGGVTGLLPDTGIPLPFMSSGGSSLIVVLFACGLLANIARQPRASTELVATPARAATTATPPPRRSARSQSPARAGARRPTAPARRAATSARTEPHRGATGSRQRGGHPRPAAKVPQRSRAPRRSSAPRRSGVMAGSRAEAR